MYLFPIHHITLFFGVIWLLYNIFSALSIPDEVKKAPECMLGSLDFVVFIYGFVGVQLLDDRSDPTVLPPSRIFMPEITVFSCDFQMIFGGFLFNIQLVSDVFQIFVIMVLSQSFYIVLYPRYLSIAFIRFFLDDLERLADCIDC